MIGYWDRDADLKSVREWVAQETTHDEIEFAMGSNAEASGHLGKIAPADQHYSNTKGQKKSGPPVLIKEYKS